MTFLRRVISVAIEPGKASQEKLGTAIQKLAEEDDVPGPPRRGDRSNPVISGMGELHLEILVDRMRREFNVEANVGKPQVAYRETIRKAVGATTTPQEADRWFGPVRRVRSRSSHSR